MAFVIGCAALWLGIAGCDDATGPGPAEVAGDYVLVEYASETLPTETGTFTVFDAGTEITCTIVLTAGSLRLESNGEYLLSYDRETECDDGRLSLDGTSEGGTFTVAGDTIRFFFDAFLGGATRTAVRDEATISFREANSNVTRAMFELASP